MKFKIFKNALKEPTIKPKETLDIGPVPTYSPHQFMTMSNIDFLGRQIHAGITRDKTADGGMKFIVIEPALNKREIIVFELIKKLLMTELTVSLNEIKNKSDAERRLKSKITRLIKEYKMQIPEKNIDKIIYYAIRDFVYLGKIEPLMRDHMIEEISCDGVGIPLYIWHREYESVPTNIMFDTPAELDNFARKLAYISGKHVSMADPIIDASLPEGSRINLTLGNEITKNGSTFTIRRFRADPITIIDLIKFGTVSKEIAAFMWYLVEKRATMIVSGGTASGKTTTLNALSSFIVPGQKVVSIEDTHELNLPHENWIPSVSRQNFTATAKVGEITQFDLLRAALRQRPDIIIVGETRGREAHTLFQAMATGHGGFSSLHADTIDAALARLTSSPMDVPNALISNSLDVMTLQLKLRMGERSVRRIIRVSEIGEIDERTGNIKTHDVFKWNPKTDVHEYLGNSLVMEKIKSRYGETDEKIEHELNKRKTALEWMEKNDMRGHLQVNAEIKDFYLNSEKYYERKKIAV